MINDRTKNDKVSVRLQKYKKPLQCDFVSLKRREFNEDGSRK